MTVDRPRMLCIVRPVESTDHTKKGPNVWLTDCSLTSGAF